MTGRGKKPSETKRTHQRSPDSKPQVPEEPSPDDDIYMNSPDNMSEPKKKKAQRETCSKPNVTQQKTVNVNNDMEVKECPYSSLDLAQKDSVDVYEAQVTTVTGYVATVTGPETTLIKPEPIKETSIPLEEILLPNTTRASDPLIPCSVHFIKKYKKKILVIVGLVFLAFMASIFGGLIVGSAMSSMVADKMQSSKCPNVSTTNNTPIIVTNATMEPEMSTSMSSDSP